LSDAGKEESLCNFDHLQKVMKAFWYTVFVFTPREARQYSGNFLFKAEISPSSVKSPTEFHIPTLKTAEKRIKHKHLIKISYI
jgi:hypothetical protein